MTPSQHPACTASPTATSYLRNSNTQGIADIKFYFGNPGDVPLAGDFNGDGCDTVSIYRQTEGQVYIINKLGENNGGLGAADYHYYFGNPGDKPFVGDFNGDGVDTVGLHRESSGFLYFRNTNTQGIADFQFFFGNPGDRLIAGDWTGDGNDTPAVYRPSNTTFYYRYTNTQGNADAQRNLGAPRMAPGGPMSRTSPAEIRSPGRCTRDRPGRRRSTAWRMHPTYRPTSKGGSSPTGS